MNWDKLKRNIGYKVQMVPVACHLDTAGDILPPRGEDWIITSSGADFLEIDAGVGGPYRLGKDHVHHYTSDAHRSADGDNYGFLTLNVQLFIQGTIIRAVPNSRPGAPVDPAATDKTARARVHFIPEVERRFRRQIQILDRCLVSYGLTSHDKLANPSDTWASLRPSRTSLYPNAPRFTTCLQGMPSFLRNFIAQSMRSMSYSTTGPVPAPCRSIIAGTISCTRSSTACAWVAMSFTNFAPTDSLMRQCPRVALFFPEQRRASAEPARRATRS